MNKLISLFLIPVLFLLQGQGQLNADTASQGYSPYNIVLIHGLSDNASCWNETAPVLAGQLQQAGDKWVEIGIVHSIKPGALCMDGSLTSVADQEVDCNDLGDDYFGLTDGINDGQPHFSALFGCDPWDCIFGLDKGQFDVSGLHWKFKDEAFITADPAEKLQHFKDYRLFAVNFSNSEHLTFSAQGAELKAAIDDIADITGVSDFILIGHSMGGLAARAYLQNETTRNIKGLVTIDTPHLGGQEWFGVAAGAYNFKGNAPLNLHTDSLALKNLNDTAAIGSAYDNTMVFHLGYAKELSTSGATDYYAEDTGDGIVYTWSQMGPDAVAPYRVIFSSEVGSSNAYENPGGGFSQVSETVLSNDHDTLLAEAHSGILEDGNLHAYLVSLLPMITGNALSANDTGLSAVRLKTNLSFKLPDAGFSGDAYTIGFSYWGTDNGKLYWQVSGISANGSPAGADSLPINPDLSFIIPQLNYYGTQLWAGFEYGGEIQGNHLWYLDNAGTGTAPAP